jgi:hypothetical protein
LAAAAAILVAKNVSRAIWGSGYLWMNATGLQHFERWIWTFRLQEGWYLSVGLFKK